MAWINLMLKRGASLGSLARQNEARFDLVTIWWLRWRSGSEAVQSVRSAHDSGSGG